jgi:hypothetical protein
MLLFTTILLFRLHRLAAAVAHEPCGHNEGDKGSDRHLARNQAVDLHKEPLRLSDFHPMIDERLQVPGFQCFVTHLFLSVVRPDFCAPAAVVLHQLELFFLHNEMIVPEGLREH